MRLANEILFGDFLGYSEIEHVDPELTVNLPNRFIDLNRIFVDRPVQDIERFLDFLKSFNIVELYFRTDQPQELFDRLPD